MQDNLQLPEEFIKRMKSQLEDDFDAFISSYDSSARPSLRVNPLKHGFEEIEKIFPSATDSVLWEKYGRYYDKADEPGRNALHNAGAYYIQESSAMSPVSFLKPQEGERILDLCAAPGGKTTQIAGYMNGKGILFANEPVPKRAKILSENVERLGIRNCVVINHDPWDFEDKFPNFFHKILVDAPCSGEGMFRKDNAVCKEWSEENVKKCAARQLQILDSAASMLMPGGTLVYSTCTFSPDEDEKCIIAFLEKHSDFSLCDDINLTGGMVPGCAKRTVPGTVRLWPHLIEGEGHFVAVLKKEGVLFNDTTSYFSQETSRLSKDEMEVLGSFLNDSIIGQDKLYSADNFLRFKDELYIMPESLPSLKGIKVLRTGLHLGTFEKKRFEPSHALALSLNFSDSKRNIILDDFDANQYLKGMTIQAKPDMAVGCDGLALPELVNGWYLVLYKGYSLGWCKYAGGIFKNHYPKGLRLH